MESHCHLLLVSAMAVIPLSSLVQAGTHLDRHWFRWSGGRVPYFFQPGVTNPDRSLARQVMRQIERKTCVRFHEHSSKRPPSGHHLEIRVLSNNTCMGRTRRGGGHPRFSAAVFAQPPARKKVVLQSMYRVADRRECRKENEGGLLHEMMHLFGVMHTQMRADRDKYITVYKNNIIPYFRSEYDICSECNDHGVPYDCNSIMHYGAETFSTGRWTMQPKRASCKLNWFGSASHGGGATVNDWELLRRITDPLCSARKRPRNIRRGKSLDFSSDDKFDMIYN